MHTRPTVLTIMVDEGEWTCNLVLFADDTTPSEIGRGAANAHARHADASLGYTMTPGTERTDEHDMAKAGERGQNVHEQHV